MEDENLEQQKNSIPANADDNKSTDSNKPPLAPQTEDKSADTPTKEVIDETLDVLNYINKRVGGKGKLSAQSSYEEMKPAIAQAIKWLVFVKGLYADPKYSQINDDLHDQKEDGKEPSVDAAIARIYGPEGIQELLELAENENYEDAQNKVTDSLNAQKDAENQEKTSEENFQYTLKEGEAYAKEMGYSEEEKNELFNFMIAQYKIWGDGKVDKEEWKKIDKMRNYDSDIQSLSSQITASPKSSKEVLPDQSSMDAAPSKVKREDKPAKHNGPGLGSIADYSQPLTDITAIKGQKRRGRGN